MAEPTNHEHRSKKARSPRYPGIDLGKALERARIVYQREAKHIAPASVVMEHWGYAPRSSPGLVTVAALRAFGLLDSPRDGEVKLSELALRIIQDTREVSPEREAAIREAALKPKIHAEVWAHYNGNLPSNQTLRFYLLREKSFTETGADEFIRQFRATISFAKLDESVTLSEPGEDKVIDESPGEFDQGDAMTAAAPPLGSSETPSETKDFQFTVTLYGGRLATVKTPVPMTKRNLERLKRMIADQLEPFVTEEDDPEAA